MIGLMEFIGRLAALAVLAAVAALGVLLPLALYGNGSWTWVLGSLVVVAAGLLVLLAERLWTSRVTCSP